MGGDGDGEKNGRKEYCKKRRTGGELNDLME